MPSSKCWHCGTALLLMASIPVIVTVIGLAHLTRTPRCPCHAQALAGWAALADRFSSSCSASSGSGSSSSPGFLPFAAAAAAEEGLALLSRQSEELTDPLQAELAALEAAAAEGDAAAAGSSSQGEPPEVSLDELAAEARRQHPDLFPPSTDSTGSTDGGSSSGGAGAGGGELQRRRAAALAALLHRQHRFRHEPFEWVYEGLAPLLLPPRLRRRKLAPLAAAAVAAGVGRRLGLPLLPVPAESGEGLAAAVTEGPAGGAAAAGGLPLERLRPDVAQRYAGRAGGAPPAAGPWVLLVPAAGDGAQQQQQQRGQQQAWSGVMDACTGEVLEPAAARARWPALSLGPEWALRAPLTAWQHAVRTVIQVGAGMVGACVCAPVCSLQRRAGGAAARRCRPRAAANALPRSSRRPATPTCILPGHTARPGAPQAHQRRGESDLVAHWVYVLLALDPQAEEWAHVLGGGGVAA